MTARDVTSQSAEIDAPMGCQGFSGHFFGLISGDVGMVRTVLLDSGQDREGPLAVEGKLL
jgi:hypothetical protein